VEILGSIAFGFSWFTGMDFELRKLQTTTDSQVTSFDKTT